MFIICVVFTSCKTANTAVSTGNVEFVRTDVKHDSDETVQIIGIPIMAWTGVQEHTIERYRELKEAGIDYNLTVGSAMPNADLMEKAMNLAKVAGVRMWLHCPELYNDTENTINRFKNHPALAGYFIVDEAPVANFPSVGEFVLKVQSVDNVHFCYVNLGPDWNSEEQCRNYIKSFFQQVPVTLLSYDDYPIMIDNNGVRFLSYRWWIGLKVFSEESKNLGIPWWGFALTAKHTVTWDTPNRIYPMPTLADLRFQVYCNLAYGAQGIQYFTYWATDLPSSESPIGRNGERTEIWYTVQQMGREIKALSSVFLGAQVIKVEHIATNASGRNGDIPIGTTRFNFAKRPKEASIIKTFTTPNNTNALVSFLKNGNRCYMIVINLNLEGGDNATFTITGGAGLQLINKDGVAVPVLSKNSKQIVTPGDALIYGWDY